MNTNRFNFSSNESTRSGLANLKGTLLVSTERLRGSRFEKAVVLLMQHDEKGTFGVTLNKPANAKVRKAWSELTGETVPDEQAIVAGGPLHGPVFALHQDPTMYDVEMTGGLYVSAQVDKLQQLTSQFENPYRIVIGIAGWKPGQLSTEVNDGYWYQLPMDIDLIFDDPEWMWDFCLQECGRRQVADIIGNDNIPFDPSLN